ncbi:hypothetical protein A616_28790 [Brevibacillus brevis X23]|nr:hypothetical protein A616_28790 [Brevibacillus brevis X23]
MIRKREQRAFTDELKQQMVQLYENGKPRADIIREYDLSASAFDSWVKQSRTTGSFFASVKGDLRHIQLFTQTEAV